MLDKFKIFVAIASYRDWELPKTVRDLMQKASHPERITIGICNQINLEEERGLISPPSSQIKEMIIDYRVSKGACWARSLTLEGLLREEDFVLQIDAHMRFQKGWDDQIIASWMMTKDPKAIVTHYPPNYDPEKPINYNYDGYMYFHSLTFDSDGLHKIGSGSAPARDLNAPMQQTFHVAAGCLFAPADAFREVRYDPQIYFTGEEHTLAARFWTHGYNIYLPNRSFLFHQYNDKGKDVKPKRIMHWSDHSAKGVYAGLAKKGSHRTLKLLDGFKSIHASSYSELEKFGLGNVRTLDQWRTFSGVNLRAQTLAEKTKKGIDSFGTSPYIKGAT